MPWEPWHRIPAAPSLKTTTIWKQDSGGSPPLPVPITRWRFRPTNLKHDGAFHPLKVTLVSGKGLNVQARKGYYAPKKAEDLAAQETEDLQDATFSTDEVQGLPIQVNTQYFMLNKTDAEIDVVTHVICSRCISAKKGIATSTT